MTVFQCKQPLLQWNGVASLDDNGRAWQAGPFLALYLGTSLAVHGKEAERAHYLAIRLHFEESVPLSPGDQALIRKVLDAAPGLHAFLHSVLSWMTDPENTEPDLRNEIESLYRANAGPANTGQGQPAMS